MTWFILVLSNIYKSEILANYTLYGVKYFFMRVPPVSPNRFLEDIKNRICAFDELQNWANCRESQTHKNQHINKVQSLSRHSKSHIFYTTQRMGKVDKVLREEPAYIIRIRNTVKLKNDKYPNGIPIMITYEAVDMDTYKMFRRTIDVRWVLKHYDTNEILYIPDGTETEEGDTATVKKGKEKKTKDGTEFSEDYEYGKDLVFEAKLLKAKRQGKLKKGC